MGNETNQYGIEPSTSLPFLIGEGSTLDNIAINQSYEPYDYARAFYQLGKIHYDKADLSQSESF